MAKPSDNPETIVSANMRIEGELKSNGSIRIDGIITGKVQTSGDLAVGSSAQIDADLIAQNAVIGGIIKGNVTVKQALVILETGKILGNVSCSSLGIREGAYFSGNCRMQDSKVPQPEPEE